MTKKDKQSGTYRGVRDEIRREQMKTRDMTFKQKLSYFWYYYKIHTIAGILVIIFAVSCIHDIITAKDFNFYGIMMNSFQLSSEKMEAGFGEYAGLDMENYECFIDTDSTLSLTSTTQYDMATAQKLMALIQTKDIDAVVFDAQLFNHYSNNELFMDLRQVLTSEELEACSDDLYYVDYALIRAASEAEADSSVTYDVPPEPTQEEIAAEAETHRHPEAMTEPIPVGIFIADSPFAKETSAYSSLIPVFGFPVSTQRLETAKKYLEFLWDETVDFSGMIETY